MDIFVREARLNFYSIVNVDFIEENYFIRLGLTHRNVENEKENIYEMSQNDALKFGLCIYMRGNTQLNELK